MTPREYLASLEFHGIKLGLDNIRHILAQAGNPEAAFPSIHVAGSNGKGSVVAVLDAILRAAGYRTGRFTSPHLRDLRERFAVNGNLVPDDELDAEIEFFRAIGDRMDPPPTYFEINTAIAFRHFARHNVDVAIVEVGMGGRFDSTNVIDPEVAVITSISLEHTKYLGESLEAIAFEKAGILKRGRPVVIGAMDPGPRSVILERARELECPVRVVGEDYTIALRGPAFEQRIDWRGESLTIDDAPLSLPGRYQGQNAAMALAAAEILRDRFPRITADTLREGLRAARWPGRLDQVLDNPPVILDVSHNPAGMRELASALPQRCVVVLAVASDKDARAILQAIDPICETLILTRFNNHRAMDLDTLCAATTRNYIRAETVETAIALAIERADTNSPLLITGSFHTVGEAHEILERNYAARPLHF